ncbi:hypothetical protein SCHPADRAFT_820460 [Schizopora paradoxa]|uniref:Nuclear segregation protein Bfr1 n=1 Tax=Schizopora paradoxa TaxID=27342 RepID=A0A0H2S8W2_9AGAM|nr:hypothetical protein SCHPADRAFT_820460 [Schizopora paradoxa]
MPAAAKGKAPAATNGAATAKGGAKKGEKKGESSAAASGTATPTTTVASESAGGSGRDGKIEKPDKKKYDDEQNALRAEIDDKQAKRGKLEEQIRSLQGGGEAGEKRKALREELTTLNSNRNSSRSKLFEQINALKDAQEKKKKDLHASKGKIPYKSLDELNDHIKHLEKQVEAATLKLVDEKKALRDISAGKRLRRNLEALQADQEAINKDQAAIEALHKQLDDPELKAAHDRADAIYAELEKMRKDGDELHANKQVLVGQSSALKAEIDALYTRKRESTKTYKDAGDRYWTKVNADRERRQQEYKAKREKEENEKKRAVALELREEAELPAFQEEIEDCQTLIDFFSGKGTGVKERADPASSKVALVGVPELELRQVETAPAAGFVQSKKKGEDEDVYFAGTKGKGKGKKNGGKAKPNGSAAADAATNGDAPSPAPSSSDKLQVPLATLRALLKMSIPPPSSPADVPRTVEDLRTKKAWFEANQARVTKENIAKAEAQIQKLSAAQPTSTKGSSKSGTATPASEILPPNGDGENPAEPIPTPLQTDTLSVGVESEKVDEVLEEVQEEEVQAES